MRCFIARAVGRPRDHSRSKTIRYVSVKMLSRLYLHAKESMKETDHCGVHGSSGRYKSAEHADALSAVRGLEPFAKPFPLLSVNRPKSSMSLAVTAKAMNASVFLASQRLLIIQEAVSCSLHWFKIEVDPGCREFLLQAHPEKIT